MAGSLAQTPAGPLWCQEGWSRDLGAVTCSLSSGSL